METSVQPGVYLVEDSPIMVRLLRELLLGIGANVVGHSRDASVATTEINALHPDAIIVDIAMPGGGGIAVLRTFAGHRQYNGPLCIVLTNYASAPYRKAAADLGVDYFFDKHLETSKMLEVIASIPARAGSQRNGSGP